VVQQFPASADSHFVSRVWNWPNQFEAAIFVHVFIGLFLLVAELVQSLNFPPKKLGVAAVLTV
jgi:hypothetical protein